MESPSESMYKERSAVLRGAGITYEQIVDDLCFRYGYMNSAAADKMTEIVNSPEFTRILKKHALSLIKNTFTQTEVTSWLKDEISNFLNS